MHKTIVLSEEDASVIEEGMEISERLKSPYSQEEMLLKEALDDVIPDQKDENEKPAKRKPVQPRSIGNAERHRGR